MMPVEQRDALCSELKDRLSPWGYGVSVSGYKDGPPWRIIVRRQFLFWRREIAWVELDGPDEGTLWSKSPYHVQRLSWHLAGFMRCGCLL